jgi:hypothetical protein
VFSIFVRVEIIRLFRVSEIFTTVTSGAKHPNEKLPRLRSVSQRSRMNIENTQLVKIIDQAALQIIANRTTE